MVPLSVTPVKLELNEKRKIAKIVSKHNHKEASQSSFYNNSYVGKIYGRDFVAAWKSFVARSVRLKVSGQTIAMARKPTQSCTCPGMTSRGSKLA